MGGEEMIVNPPADLKDGDEGTPVNRVNFAGVTQCQKSLSKLIT